MNIDEEYVRRGVEISIDATPVQVRDFMGCVVESFDEQEVLR